MRKLKYIAWHNQTGNMVFWDELKSIAEKAICHPLHGHPHFDLMEYTGKEDRNSKDIHEGHILEYTDRDGDVCRGHVKWLDSEIGYRIYDKIEDTHYSYHLQFVHEYGDGGIIIGNIFQDPQLLPKNPNN